MTRAIVHHTITMLLTAAAVLTTIATARTGDPSLAVLSIVSILAVGVWLLIEPPTR